ncbi:MAG: TerC family protein [Candidatus Nanopelagicaceae bacterium]
MSLGVWEITIGVLALVLIFDFAMAYKQRNVETSLATAVSWTLFYIALAVGFGISLGQWADTQAQNEFFAGWLTEYSLSFDNLFVFVLILARLKVAKEKEQLVLLFGIAASLLMRGGFIAVGSVVVSRFAWIFFFFGAFLIYTAFKLIKESEEEEWEEGRFITYLRNKGASTFALALVAIAMTDVLFAFDSIPAIFGLTKDPYIIVTANIFALMGLRQLYFLIGGLMAKLVYLTEGLSAILGFIGIKLIIEALHNQHWDHIGDFSIPHISLQVSLGFIIITLISTSILSLLKTRKG